MATKQKTTHKKRTTAKTGPELIEDEGRFYIVSGTKRLDVGISRRYAEKMLAELK
jgi:hypothetical protein